MICKKPALKYRLLSSALFLFWIIHALLQALTQRNFSYFNYRLGFSRHNEQPCIWVHAASVGEVELIKPLVEHLSHNDPVLVTTFTVTGLEHARKLFPPQIQVSALPIDFFPISWLFMRFHKFKLGLIAETELWPETLYQACKKNIPLLQINARLSTKSLQNPDWIKHILSTTLGYFDLHLTRNQQDLEKLLSMGVDKGKVISCGNLKFAQPAVQQDYDKLIERPYILFASTHEPEERLIAQMIKDLQTGQLAVIAPRHPIRAARIQRSLKPLKMNISQRSKGDSISEQTELYLADTLGELKALMAHASLVVMGGSFDNTGGHNLLEPAAIGKAIITGPSDDNIRQDITLLNEHDGIIQVTDIQTLSTTINELLHQPHRIEQLARNASNVMQQQSHIFNHYVERIEDYL
jgi:3-deoxy-D-manno-octulosonic-acid transferase